MTLLDTAAQLRAQLADPTIPDDLERLAAWCWQLRQTKAALEAVLIDSEAVLYEVAGKGNHELPGVPPFEARRGAVRKKWQSDDLVRLLVRRGLDPAGTGEVTAAQVEAVERVVAELVACAPFTPSMGWRATALRERGLDPEEFCESAPGRVSVQWHGAAA